MTKVREIYRCQICGNVVEVVNPGAVLSCCGSCCGVSCFGGSCDACAFSSAIGFSLMFMSLSFIISFLLFLVWRFCS